MTEINRNHNISPKTVKIFFITSGITLFAVIILIIPVIINSFKYEKDTETIKTDQSAIEVIPSAYSPFLNTDLSTPTPTPGNLSVIDIKFTIKNILIFWKNIFSALSKFSRTVLP
jgi:hypothetical protein